MTYQICGLVLSIKLRKSYSNNLRYIETEVPHQSDSPTSYASVRSKDGGGFCS